MNNNNKTFLGSDIALGDLISLLLHRWWLILVVMLIGALIGFGGTKCLVSPTYQSSFTAYVNNNGTEKSDTTFLTNSDVTAARSLASTYAEIIACRPLLEEAIKETGLDYSYSEVKNSINISKLNETEIIKVDVIMDSPNNAYQLAGAIQTIAPNYISDIIIGTSMMIVAPAEFPENMYGPNYIRNLVAGAAVGFFLACVYILSMEIFDKRVKSVDELKNLFDIPVIGVIHNINEVDSKSGYGYYQQSSNKDPKKKKGDRS